MEAPTAWQEVHRPPHGVDFVADSDYELPAAYGEDKLTLLVRDPECVFAFWEVTDAGWRGAVGRLPEGNGTPELVLRVYKLEPSNIVFERPNILGPSNTSGPQVISGPTSTSGPQDISGPTSTSGLSITPGSPITSGRPNTSGPVTSGPTGADWHASDVRGYTDFFVAGTSGWYVHTETPGLVLGAEIGVKRGDAFAAVARSRAVATPPGHVSDDTDADWMTVEELYRLVAQMPVGTSSPAVDAVLSRRRHVELSSGFMFAMGEAGFSPGFSPGFSAGFHTRSAPTGRVGFRTVPRNGAGLYDVHVTAEVVLFGRVSNPSAVVTVSGKPVPMAEDGRFQLRLPLPDGTQVLPVEVRFPDGSRRAVTPVISRETF